MSAETTDHEQQHAWAREYAAAQEGAGLAELSDRVVLAVTGPLRQKFLHSILSNDVQGRKPGEGCLAALMDVKGHLLAFLRALVTQDAVLLETSAARLPVVERLLAHYRVAAPVKFQARPTVVLGVIGPGAAEAVTGAGGPAPPAAAESHVSGAIAGQAVLVARASDLPLGGLVVHGAPEGAAAIRDALQAARAMPIGEQVLDALRIEAGRPWYGPDVGEENLLHETGLLREYHSATKGCYVGQEVVARLEGRGGHVNKVMRGLRLSSPVASGTPLLYEGKEIGRITTAAVSPRLGSIALGYVHRTRAEPGTVLQAGAADATVTALPFAS